MRRHTASLCAFACATAASLCAASAAAAGTGRGSVTGKIVYIGASTVTVQTGGRMLGVNDAINAAAGALVGRNYPYVWGGGHGAAGVASIGVRGGPGYNGRRLGFDCSGAIAAVFSAAGLWPAGSAVPNDAGVIDYLRRGGLLVPGAGTAPNEVTLYDRPGVHIFMNVDGRFFGTSDGGSGNPQGHPTWIYDGAPDSFRRSYRRYHLLPSVLRDRTSYGHDYTFQTRASPTLMQGAEPGERVKLSYAGNPRGSMNARAISYAGAVTVQAAVLAVAPDGSSITLQPAPGRTVTLATSLVPRLIAGLQAGDGIRVTYSRDLSHRLVPHVLKIVSVPPPPPPSPPLPPTPIIPTAPAAGG